MYTKRNFSLPALLYWTRRELVIFSLIAALPVVAYDLFDQRWIQLPWLPIALIGTAVAFLVGFQNNATYGRLWEARKIWGGITNTSRNFGCHVTAFVSDQFAPAPVGMSELASIHERLVLRHVAWLTTLRHAMRQPRPWEQQRRHPTNREWIEKIQVREHRMSVVEELEGLLDPLERDAVLALANPSAQLLRLQSNDLARLRERGLLDDFRHLELARTVGTLTDLQGASERIKNFPYPRQYSTLNEVFVWIFLVLIPFGLVHQFGGVGDDLLAEFPKLGACFVWLTVPFSVVVMWMFHTMDRIGGVSENPFAGSPNDIPITTMSRGMEIDLREMLGQPPSDIPEPIQAHADTQT